jgi:hypothetical protein
MARLPVGASGQVLQADTSLSVGMKWTTLGAAVQTPWVTNVDAAGYQLVNASRVGVAMVPGYPLDVTGDINYTGVLRHNGAPVSFGGSQTPWTSHIDAAGFNLGNVGAIGIGGAATSARLGIAGGTLGTTAGSGIIFQTAQALSGNNDTLTTALWRTVAGGLWDSTAWRIGRQIDSVDSSSIELAYFTVALRTQGQQRFVVDGAGNCGIGAAPGSRLHIAAASTSGNISTAHQFHLGVDGNLLYGLQMGYFDTGGAGIASVLQNWQGAAGGNLLLQPSGGNVAIGHTGAAAINSALHINRSASGAVGPIVTLENSTGALHDAAAIRFWDANLRSELRFAVDNSPYGADMIFFSDGLGATTERFRVTSAGNVGIAVTNPLAPLHVRTANGGETMRLSCDAYALGSGPVIGFYFVDTNYAAAIGTYGVGGNAADLVFSTANGTAPAERMRITADGRVGIGVTPNAANGLEVNVYQKWAAFCPNIGAVMPPNNNGVYLGWNYSGGAAEAVIAFNGGPSGLVLADTTGSTYKERLRVTAGGNVGIGGVPGYKLDVNGDVNIAAGSVYRIAGVPLSFAPVSHTHDASAIVSGVLATARLGAGTANSSVFLRGDGQWAAPAGAGGVTTQTANLAGATRVFDTTYTNSSGKPMFVIVSANVSGGSSGQTGGIAAFSGAGTPVMVGSNSVMASGGTPAIGTGTATLGFWVLPGNSYKVSVSGSGTGTIATVNLSFWVEWY